jgi:hypothetical protein
VVGAVFRPGRGRGGDAGGAGTPVGRRRGWGGDAGGAETPVGRGRANRAGGAIPRWGRGRGGRGRWFLVEGLWLGAVVFLVWAWGACCGGFPFGGWERGREGCATARSAPSEWCSLTGPTAREAPPRPSDPPQTRGTGAWSGAAGNEASPADQGHLSLTRRGRGEAPPRRPGAAELGQAGGGRCGRASLDAAFAEGSDAFF